MHLNVFIKETIEIIALCDRVVLLVNVYVNLWCFWESLTDGKLKRNILLRPSDDKENLMR